MPRHGLVCDRHIGVGLSSRDIQQQNLPLPPRDMVPKSLEERIIAYADLFFSKDPGLQEGEKTAEDVRASLSRFGAEKVAIFNEWHGLFAL